MPTDKNRYVGVGTLIWTRPFVIVRRNELEPRAIPIDKNRYEVHFVHFKDKQKSNQSSH